MNPKVNFFFDKAKQWQDELRLLREIALHSNLVEELKWGVPCYTLNGKNVVLIHAFKEYCALLFHKGVLLKDPANLLIQQTENVQSARQLRFTSLTKIESLKTVVLDYIFEAAKVEESGMKVPMKTTAEFSLPDELLKHFESMPEFKKAFEALTPGRQRGYALFFSQPKQAKTREARIEKSVEAILAGKGLND